MRLHLAILAFLIMFTTLAAAETWTLVSGITIVKESGPLTGNPEPTLSVRVDGNDALISITDFFYNAGRFEQPWMSVANRNKATITIATHDTGNWFFSTKEEHVRSIELKINHRRLPSGTILYIYNQDTGEVMGHAVIP